MGLLLNKAGAMVMEDAEAAFFVSVFIAQVSLTLEITEKTWSNKDFFPLVKIDK